MTVNHAAETHPARVAARRLNRAEYNYSVQDLLGVNLQPAADFPPDDSGYGFDNIGDVLSLSPMLMEHYLDAAERVAQMAVFGPRPMHPTVAQYQSATRNHIVEPSPLAAADPTGLSHPTSLHARHNFPADAEYAFQATVGGSELPGSEVHLAAWIDGEEIATLDGITGHKLEMRAHVTAGEHTVSLSYLRLGRTGRINLLEIDGPFDLATGPDERCRKLLYTCGHLDGRHEPGCGRKIVGDCAHRAFRRPVTPAEVERLTSLAAMAQARGASFEEGLTVAIQAILVSPNFLFHLRSESLAARL